MKNRKCVNLFIQDLPCKLKCISNKNKLHDSPIANEPVVPFETLKNSYQETPFS